MRKLSLNKKFLKKHSNNFMKKLIALEDILLKFLQVELKNHKDLKQMEIFGKGSFENQYVLHLVKDYHSVSTNGKKRVIKGVF